MHLLTVFTPTYNRAEYLKKCYDSLVKQTSTDFVWQVVDDGSDDGLGVGSEDDLKEVISGLYK